MSKEEKYYTFPLSVLNGRGRKPTASECLTLAIRCGVLNAGKGFLKRNDFEVFEGKLNDACERFERDVEDLPDLSSDEGILVAQYLVGASICDVDIPSDYNLEEKSGLADRVPTSGKPFIRMSARSLWAAV